MGLLMLLVRGVSASSCVVTPSIETDDVAALGPRRLRYAEGVLRRRTSRLIVVLDASVNTSDQMAILRTCDCLGVQHVWIVTPEMRQSKGTVKQRAKRAKRAMEMAEMRNLLRDRDEVEDELVANVTTSKHKSRQAAEWLTIRSFNSSSECAQALKDASFEVWEFVFSSDGAVQLEAALRADDKALPFSRGHPLALAFGDESEGITDAIRGAADRSVYLPTMGVSECGFGLTVSCALAMQKVLDLCPKLSGDLTEAERAALRKRWFMQLAKTADQMRDYPEWVNSPPEPLMDFRRPVDQGSGAKQSDP